MNERQQRFIDLLRQIFEIDKSDLDFGIYRILNIRKKEIEDFFVNKLPKQITDILAPFANGGKDEMRQKMAVIEQQCGGAANIALLPDTMPMKSEYNNLKTQLQQGTDIAALENDVYSALYTFFNSYYDEGDFISKRRYKDGKYAIPYEGEEVKLYWANQDQYYIKTSENFKDYTFKADNYTVHFRLVDATTEQNNNKEADDKKRKFMIFTEDEENYPGIKTFEQNEIKDKDGNVVDRELIIRFVFDVPQDSKAKWDEINFNAIKQYLAEQGDTQLMMSLLRIVNPDVPKAKQITFIQKHLNGYVAKNTFDYFIHKDLGGFLTRELDFFIKNEVMHLDDIDTDNEKTVDTYLAKVRAIKRVGETIIDFLAQLENFQKKLWMKKKFVVETNWCITLDCIDEKFYDEIRKNKEQVQEWRDMYAIHEIKEDDDHKESWSDVPTVDFLKENKNLIVDTKHFSDDFKNKLIASIDDLDEKTGGLMINADNSQAIRFIKNRYNKSIQTTYIDPPYNTVYSKILYKNNYEHSSWLSLLSNNIPYVSQLWTKDFSFGLAIDDYEFVNLSRLLDNNFSNLERSVAIVNHHPQGSGGRLSRTHEYYIMLSDPASPSYLGEPLEDYQEDRNFMRSGRGENNFRQFRWKSFYALLMNPSTRQIVDVEDAVPLGESYPTGPTSEGFERIYPINSRGEERVWRSSYETGRQRAKNGELFVTPRGAVLQAIDHESKREVLMSNWTETKFNAGTNGTTLLDDMGLGGKFDYPKSIYTLEIGLWAQTFGRDNGVVLDYFGGSGTTGHAVINLNRKYGGERSYILVEMGEYFNTATRPRIMKAVYSSEWNAGKPTSRNTGISHIMKYLRLESYEDALSNIKLQEQNGMRSLFGDDYLINYMLDLEAKESLLNIKAFTTPFDYEMKITEKNECKEQRVDVCETFNYLIGLTVVSQGEIRYFNAVPARNPKYEGAVDLAVAKNGEFAFRQIEGTVSDADGNKKKVLVIWRNITDDLMKSNAALDAYFEKNRINPQDREYDIIYVNGDSNLENLRNDDESWKVVMTETEFNKRMFEEA